MLDEDISRAIKSLTDLAFLNKVAAAANFTRSTDLLHGVDLQLPKVAGQSGRGATELKAQAGELQIV